jgi:recombinational DNA repair ATPase RecF
MLITSVRIQHYKSFLDSGEITLGSGFNVIVGQNNAGKTALLEGLGLRAGNNPHRSMATLPTRGTHLNVQTQVQTRFALGRQELFDVLADLGERAYVPIPAGNSPDSALQWSLATP